MRIAIIEDEKLTADDLAETIWSVEPRAQIAAVLHSVEETIAYFRNPANNVELIFSDIQLGDGLSFDAFRAVPLTCPIIFCTAYDTYALDAFKANGIDYILKPFTKTAFADALARYTDLKNHFSSGLIDYEKIAEWFGMHKNRQEASVLVYQKDKIIPVKLTDIALFYSEDETTRLVTFNIQLYNANKTLEELEKLAGNDFFRVNRKFLINRKAIKYASHYFHRKLLVNLSIPFTVSRPITVGKVKVTAFLSWLSGF